MPLHSSKGKRIVGFPEIKTDGGHRAIIYTTDAGGSQPFHGAWFAEYCQGWIIVAWYPDGRKTHLGISALDITVALRNNEIKIALPPTEK